MDTYTLYLDEGKLVTKGEKSHNVYGIAGVIIVDSQTNEINNQLVKLKQQIFSKNDVILHATDLKHYNSKRVLKRNPDYAVLTKRKDVRAIFNGIGQIINDYCNVMGAVIDMTALKNNYTIRESSYTSYYIGMKTIMENYTKFLYDKKATGRIVLESRKTNTTTLDKRIRKQYYKVMNHGTYRYSAIQLQERLIGITFIPKSANNNLLQIADFIPTPLLFNYLGIKQGKPNIYQEIRKNRYYGTHDPIDSKKYGVVIIN